MTAPLVFRESEPRPAARLVGFLSQKDGAELHTFNTAGQLVATRRYDPGDTDEPRCRRTAGTDNLISGHNRNSLKSSHRIEHYGRMKIFPPLLRSVITLFTVLFAVSAIVEGQQCADSIDDITECPDEGCGDHEFDPELNKRKNIRSDDQQPVLRSIRWMKGLEDPKNFTSDNTNRDELKELGEGQKITVVAWALVARKGGKETCNCGLSKVKDTDNHIVLVDPAVKKPTIEDHECSSVTAEFTPRVRLDHPNLARAKLNPLIDPESTSSRNPVGKLLVRATGLLMFDSHHFLKSPLPRDNNWEIHPILKMEYCPKNEACRADSDDGWKNLEDE